MKKFALQGHGLHYKDYSPAAQGITVPKLEFEAKAYEWKWFANATKPVAHNYLNVLYLILKLKGIAYSCTKKFWGPSSVNICLNSNIFLAI